MNNQEFATGKNSLIGRITRKPLREVWQHEAKDFTTWLEENMDVLADVLGFAPQNPEREQAAGAFSCDLVAEDLEGNVVVIENQLGKSDHDHLGKLVTYAAALNGRVAVWIVSDPRPEHVQAIVWLNSAGLTKFFLVKMEAITIGPSPPAPLLTLITGPSDESREIGDTKKKFVERYDLRRRFWKAFLRGRRQQRSSMPIYHQAITAGSPPGQESTGFRFSMRSRATAIRLSW